MWHLMTNHTFIRQIVLVAFCKKWASILILFKFFFNPAYNPVLLHIIKVIYVSFFRHNYRSLHLILYAVF